MKLMVTVQVGNRQMIEILDDIPDSRHGWRDAINEMASRIELSTFGPPGPVEEMTLEDKPFSSRNPDA
jgi:hypothetical protein